MNFARKFAMIALFFGLMSALSGCGGGKEAVEFNDKIINALQRIGPASDKFNKALERALKNPNANLDDIRAAQKSAKDTVVGIKQEGKSLKVPEKASAKALYAAYEKYLATQEDAVDNLYSDIIKILEEKTPIEARAKKIVDIGQKAEPREKAALAELDRVQKEFAKDYNIKLINK